MCYIDDIIVTGRTDQEHLSHLAAVLECSVASDVHVAEC